MVPYGSFSVGAGFGVEVEDAKVHCFIFFFLGGGGETRPSRDA